MAKDPQDRAGAIRPGLSKLGARVEGYFFGVGNGKHYLLFECDQPLDAIALEALWMALWAPGAVTSMTITEVLTSTERSL